MTTFRMIKITLRIDLLYLSVKLLSTGHPNTAKYMGNNYKFHPKL